MSRARTSVFEFRWAEGALDKPPEMALDLVSIPVDLIVTLPPPATVAAQQATRTIPIVFVATGDPVASGVVASLARPGANLKVPNYSVLIGARPWLI
jgi:putative tryptophan/tyrosine transport system substrate-binding protein